MKRVGGSQTHCCALPLRAGVEWSHSEAGSTSWVPPPSPVEGKEALIGFELLLIPLTQIFLFNSWCS